jgi:hypothetical protein
MEQQYKKYYNKWRAFLEISKSCDNEDSRKTMLLIAEEYRQKMRLERLKKTQKHLRLVK